MKQVYEAKAGPVDLSGFEPFHNPEFGYTLFEEVVDPENPDGPRAIALYVPPRSMSKAWQLVQPGYSERMELLEGSANLYIQFGDTPESMVYHLTPDAPSPYDFFREGELQIRCGDTFCVLTEHEPAVVLSRPSTDFDISFERGLTEKPTDELSRFILQVTTKIRESTG